GCLKTCVRRLCNALRKAELMRTTLHRRRRRISQTIELMSCTYICSMIPRGLISRSKASRKASNSSADSVISNGNFGSSVSSFIRGSFFSDEFTQVHCPNRSEHTGPLGSRLSSHVFALLRANQCLHCRLRLTSWLCLVWPKWTGYAADSAVKPSRGDRNGGFVTHSRANAPQQYFDSR